MTDIPFWDSLLAYVVAFFAIYFAFPAMLQALCGAVFSAVTFRASGIHIALLVGGITAWLLLALLWRYTEGGMMPFTVFAGGFFFLFAHGYISKEELTTESLKTMAAEAWGIVIAATLILWKSDPIRWY